MTTEEDETLEQRREVLRDLRAQGIAEAAGKHRELIRHLIACYSTPAAGAVAACAAFVDIVARLARASGAPAVVIAQDIHADAKAVLSRDAADGAPEKEGTP